MHTAWVDHTRASVFSSQVTCFLDSQAGLGHPKILTSQLAEAALAVAGGHGADAHDHAVEDCCRCTSLTRLARAGCDAR